MLLKGRTRAARVTAKTPFAISTLRIRSGLIAVVLLCACGPRARIPPVPVLPHSEGTTDSVTALARSLAPVLFVQRDEWFALERVAAIVHPRRRVIAYHLLWRDDAHGSWMPFTVPTDQEIVWVGYDTTLAPTDVWTFWHGKILHASWKDRGTVTVDVQWGKHGSLPRGTVKADLPFRAKLGSFYAMSWIGLPDMWLGNLTRPGPWCFCKSFRRYREFTKPLVLGERVDLVAHTADPGTVLPGVFGRPYSKKRAWP
jgi:hypothetical protein